MVQYSSIAGDVGGADIMDGSDGMHPIGTTVDRCVFREIGVYGKQVWAPVGKPVHLRMRPTAAQGKSVTLSYSSDLLTLPLKTCSFPS